MRLIKKNRQSLCGRYSCYNNASTISRIIKKNIFNENLKHKHEVTHRQRDREKHKKRKNPRFQKIITK